MTREKAIEILIKHTEDIQEEIGSGCEYCEEDSSINCISSCWVSDVDEALDSLPKVKEALEKAEKYKWHDLRKNSNDLPSEDDEEILTINGRGIYGKTVSRVFIRYKNFEFKSVVAWKYIEPFEEVKE